MSNRVFCALASGIAVLVSAGCFPRPDFIGQGLDPDSAFAQGIVVGGVALVEASAVEIKHASYLERLLNDQDHYKVAGVSLVRKLFGKNEYSGLMKHFRNERYLDKETLKTLTGLLEGYRFIAFVHFEKADVYSSEHSEILYDDKGKEKATKVTKTATLTSKVRLVVYDLGSGDTVIKDREDVTVSNTHEYEEPRYRKFSDYIIDTILFRGSEGRTAPAPPSNDKMVKAGLNRVYRILAVKERCFLSLC